jgi:hypothetical protein
MYAMWTKLLLAGLGAVLIGLAATVALKRSSTEEAVTQLVDDLVDAATLPTDAVVRPDDLADLPPPVRRYLRHVLRDGQPVVETVRIEQSGTFRAGGAGSPWRPFTATQHVTTRPPGFVWDAAIEMMPLVSVRVLDAYHDGRGVLQARVGGVLPVMDAAPSPELDEGELLRYLAEAPLYPTALLPGMGVTWTPIDDRSARATLIDRGTTASLIFHVNDRNEVARVTGERSFTRDDGTSEYRPWIGYWRAYDDRGGVRVPTEGEVAWTYPDAGEVSYWRGRIETVLYRDATASEDRRAF